MSFSKRGAVDLHLPPAPFRARNVAQRCSLYGIAYGVEKGIQSKFFRCQKKCYFDLLGNFLIKIVGLLRSHFTFSNLFIEFRSS